MANNGPIADSFNVRVKSLAELKELATAYGVTLLMVAEVEDGSFDVCVSGMRDEVEKFSMDLEG